jgi:hypothetical protein
MRNEPLREVLQPRPHRLAESNDAYPCLRLNAEWRVIPCKDGVQFILQHLHAGAESTAAPRWEGRSYCRTTEALIRCCRAYCGPIDPTAAAAMASLPDRYAPGCLAVFTTTETETETAARISRVLSAA